MKAPRRTDGDEGHRRARGAGAWKKRAEPPDQDGLVQRQLARLLSGTAPVLAVLWPYLAELDLLTDASPSPDRFARRRRELPAYINPVRRKCF